MHSVNVQHMFSPSKMGGNQVLGCSTSELLTRTMVSEPPVPFAHSELKY